MHAKIHAGAPGRNIIRAQKGVPGWLHFLVGLSVPALAACSALTGISGDYPRGWPATPLTQGNSCPDISGTYRNGGRFDRNRYEQYPRLSLSRFFVHSSSDVPGETSFVRMTSMRSGGLLVEFLPDGSEAAISRIELNEGQLTCDHGAIWLPPAVIDNYQGPTGYRVRWKLGLRKGADGSLVGEDHSIILAYFFLVPIAGSQTFWYLWPHS